LVSGFKIANDVPGLVNEVWIENVELVALDHLGRRVVNVVVSLIVLVPLEARVHAIKVPRFPRSEMVS
jgi:hypothetical protein